ncbi:MAG: hypothetical protein GX458_13760 [Phyllobacteriaceae bacterium]|nr:hypothetical protein [Phyllobacteriaceae bacterium]
MKIEFDGPDAPTAPITEVVDLVVCDAAVEVTTLFGEKIRLDDAVVRRVDLAAGVVRLERSARHERQ